MSDKPLVSIQIVVYNGEKYIRHCLNTVKNQTYENLEVIVFDNNSTDRTREIVQEEYSNYTLVAHPANLGMWPGQEKAMSYSRGEYIVVLSVDVMLDEHFVEKAVEAIERDSQIGAVQGKIYQYQFTQLLDGSYRTNRIIDTCGFILSRSRKVGNIGHGQQDGRQFNEPKEIFAVEGAVPMFRRKALEDSRIDGTVTDHDFFWYGDDLDLPWRMRLFGWKQFYTPQATAYHNRSTTKRPGRFLRLGTLAQRRAIPVEKRRLDWANVRFTIIKNDYIINILKDLPFILAREIAIFGYMLLLEPKVLTAWARFFRLLPSMLHKRGFIMEEAKATPAEIHRWFV
ncbi:MAG: glycosyltransferase family 2 protein [Candidatus Yanofskybacteria bacterium]|nr:glycosyltransferase family 2 protein [Candidatus Yanofskybacteria bacterium]